MQEGSSHTEGQVLHLRYLMVLQTIQPPELSPEEPGMGGSKEPGTNQTPQAIHYLAELTDRSKSKMLGMAGSGYSENPQELRAFLLWTQFSSIGSGRFLPYGPKDGHTLSRASGLYLTNQILPA